MSISKTKHKKQNKIIIIIIIIIIINNQTKVIVVAYLSRKKGRLYNTYHGLLSEKWILKRSQFDVSYQ